MKILGDIVNTEEADVIADMLWCYFSFVNPFLLRSILSVFFVVTVSPLIQITIEESVFEGEYLVECFIILCPHGRYLFNMTNYQLRH